MSTDIRNYTNNEIAQLKQIRDNPAEAIEYFFGISASDQYASATHMVGITADMALNGNMPIMSDQTLKDLIKMAYNDTIREEAWNYTMAD